MAPLVNHILVAVRVNILRLYKMAKLEFLHPFEATIAPILNLQSHTEKQGRILNYFCAVWAWNRVIYR